MHPPVSCHSCIYVGPPTTVKGRTVCGYCGSYDIHSSSPCPYCHDDGRCDAWVGDHWAFVPCICPLGEDRETTAAEDAAFLVAD